jgi:hypothetical protein
MSHISYRFFILICFVLSSGGGSQTCASGLRGGFCLKQVPYCKTSTDEFNFIAAWFLAFQKIKLGLKNLRQILLVKS